MTCQLSDTRAKDGSMANNQHPNEPQNKPQPQQPSSTALVELPKERAIYLAETYALTTQQVDVVRRAVCVGANDAELEFFLATCKRVGLDPFARQIWFIKRPQKTLDSRGNEVWLDVGRPETSIDGYRTIAERTGEYGGQGDMLWCDDKGKWTDVWLAEGPPHAAKANIIRDTFKSPLINVALYREFCPKYKNDKVPEMWRKMGANQIAKCAEAGGFRRGFPRDLSGLVTDTEMEHVDAASAGGFVAPPVSTPQLAEAQVPTRPSVTVPAEMPRDTTKQGDGTPAGAKPPVDVPREASRLLDSYDEQIAALMRSEDDVDREMAILIRKLADSTGRDDPQFQEVGQAITAAKQKRKQASDDGYANAVIEIVEPVLQRRWRELPTVQKGGRNA